MASEPTALSDMEYDEVSMVGIPANQAADILLFKSHKTSTTITRHSAAGVVARARAVLAKSKKVKPTNDDDEMEEDEDGGEDPIYNDKKKKVSKKERKFSRKERDKQADSGEAMPDGSYPIPDKGALRRAIQAYGRAKNKAATKRHIIKRARALKATDMLPEGWS